MLLRRCSVLLFFVFSCFHAFAGVLQGKVTDEKGEILPFATVFVKGSTLGVSANAEGQYQLNLPPGNYDVVCQIMGFQQAHFALEIKGNEQVNHNFKMSVVSLQMNEFIMKSSDDPAMYIMRKVIAKRKELEVKIKTFETDIYLKGTFKTRETPKKIMGKKLDPADLWLDSSGKGVLYLCEEEATYFKSKDKTKTIIHAVRESGNPKGLGFAQFPPVINVYSNTIQLSKQINPRGFISPINDNAFHYYKFKLEGDFVEDGHTLFKIRVTPKRLYEPLFDGILYVVDNQWVLQSLSLSATKTGNVEFLDTVRLEQIYLPSNNAKEWVVKQQMIHMAVKFFGFDIVGYFATVYDKQKVNQPIADSVFADKMVSVYEGNANKKDTAYWTKKRPIPLLEEEHKDYVKKDSLNTVYSDPKYLDSMRRKGNRFSFSGLLMSGYRYNGKEYKYELGINSLVNEMVNYNTVEGVNLSPRINFQYALDSNKNLFTNLSLRYGFNNQRANALAKLVYQNNDPKFKTKNWWLGAEFGKYVYQLNQSNPVDPFYNSFVTLTYAENYLKIYERWTAQLMTGGNLGNGIRWVAQIGFQQRLPLDNTTDYSFLKSSHESHFTSNLPDEFIYLNWSKHNAITAKLKLAFKPGVKYIQYPDFKMPQRSPWPAFVLEYIKGIPNILDSKTDYDKWSLSVRDNFSLGILGSVNYHVSTGGFLQSNWVSIPDLNHINGNQFFIADQYLESFQFAPYYKYSNNNTAYAELHGEWHLNGLLSNKLPIFRQLRWYFVTGSNAYFLKHDRNYMEVFLGIDNLGYDKFRIFRLDFVHSWDDLNEGVYGFRLGLHTSGAISFGGGDKMPSTDL